MILDIGCGNNKYEGSIGMDKRATDGVDLVADAESFPYPIKDESCSMIVMNHFYEHIKPWLSIDVMDECWRVLKNKGFVYIVLPYAGSHRYYQDPTHCNPCNETTFAYFDPDHKFGLWNIYKPKPWKIQKLVYNVNGDIISIMGKA